MRDAGIEEHAAIGDGRLRQHTSSKLGCWQALQAT